MAIRFISPAFRDMFRHATMVSGTALSITTRGVGYSERAGGLGSNVLCKTGPTAENRVVWALCFFNGV
jgi:hypothetical protein